MTYRAESKELGLLRNKCDIVPLAVLESEEEKVLEAENIVGYQGTVVCLANGGHDMAAKAYAKLGELRSVELVVVGQLVQLVAVDPALLNAKLVHDGPHQRLRPLTIGLPVPQSVVQVEEPMVTGTSFESIDNNAFSWDKIESAFCIQKEKENLLF